MSKLAAIILNYRRYNDTHTCLASILKADFPSSGQIYVVDNSQEKLEQEALVKRFSKIKLIKNNRNLGFAAGNNVAIRKILKESFDHVLIVNPDVVFPTKFFKQIVATSNREGVGVVAPAIRHVANGKTLYGLDGKVNWLWAKPVHTNLSKAPSKEIRDAEFVTFACVLIKTSVFGKIGLLDERYFMYLEDVDFCERVIREGFKIVLDTSLVVDHQTSASFAKPTQKLPISFRSHWHFISKWLHFPHNTIALVYICFFYLYLYILWSYQDLKRKIKNAPLAKEH